MDQFRRAIRIGCAGWALRSEHQHHFPTADAGTHLQRYAARFNAVEINSSFYRPHRASTYARWSASVPDTFAFAVKMPRAISHVRRLRNCTEELDSFLAEVAALGPKLGVLLLQLPPSLAMSATDAEAFFALLRDRYDGPLACEPRHRSWFDAESDALLRTFAVARVAADPARIAEASRPGGVPALCYYRLHGSPRMYYSSYSDAWLNTLAADITRRENAGCSVWCIFDNTAVGAATANAMALQKQLATNVYEAIDETA
ncbi:DUF72 domain-containing protein [Hyphomicrobium sulfonivorans]|uniref:DUF72 domain-containing protein n=1 Tax=Hyphomicrobium sulfonivorans TaxID=121290 RepID=UPI00156FF972|nr:DUF72 domain-containing protein [Hyphomicrobium sulfonivorans]MBI1651068.1 DUF72 domain-containing protein [Hyphomicrobium sulfonivorans]NSL72549.1 DUF72 domain-containing protein [Hyphomicrobium sulfonivorans]